MRFTGMDQDRVELNTCRDFFMTPEQVGSGGERGERTGVGGGGPTAHVPKVQSERTRPGRSGVGLSTVPFLASAEIDRVRQAWQQEACTATHAA